MGKYLTTEKSWVPRQGPLRLLRAQFPNVPGTVLENAAGLYQPFWLGLGRTGSTPASQLSRVALVMKLVPAESQEDVLITPPLCSVVMVLNLPAAHHLVQDALRD